ncbi:hypothetical protein M3Y94_00539600 [Aphelenchoides besseyi]|nr:hypothetical protein M3Y94_00539600 [Aphelenchoides besseyi]KAI6225774.1 hypothetical protein M3Y95_00732600 [Aphelenchoides besseyi]
MGLFTGLIEWSASSVQRDVHSILRWWLKCPKVQKLNVQQSVKDKAASVINDLMPDTLFPPSTVAPEQSTTEYASSTEVPHTTAIPKVDVVVERGTGFVGPFAQFFIAFAVSLLIFYVLLLLHRFMFESPNKVNQFTKKPAILGAKSGSNGKKLTRNSKSHSKAKKNGK